MVNCRYWAGHRRACCAAVAPSNRPVATATHFCARTAMLRMISADTATRVRGRAAVKILLTLSRLIDALNEVVGRLTYWLVLVAVLVSAGNATIRYTFNMSSNAWLEIQWYLFSAVFLFCAGYTLLHNQHIRIDVVTGRFSRRVHAWIDII